MHKYAEEKSFYTGKQREKNGAYYLNAHHYKCLLQKYYAHWV